MDSIQRFITMVVTALWGALFTWLLTKFGIEFTGENQNLIITASIVLLGGFFNAAIALLQRIWPNVEWLRFLEWLLLVPHKPSFLSFDDREDIRAALIMRKSHAAGPGATATDKLLKKL